MARQAQDSQVSADQLLSPMWKGLMYGASVIVCGSIAAVEKRHALVHQIIGAKDVTIVTGMMNWDIPSSLKAYIDNIKAKTGKTPEDFRQHAEESGLVVADLKATDLINLLAKDFGLGRGHSMAIWEVFKSSGWVNSGKKSSPRQ